MGTPALNILTKAYKRARVKGAPPYGAYPKLNSVMRKVLGRTEWSFMESSGNIVSVDAYDTGSIGATNGSADITGNETVWVEGMTGRKILIGTVEYTFTHVTGTTGTLDRVFEGATADPLDYIIYQDVYSLASDFGELIVIRDQSNNADLSSWSPEQTEQFHETPSASGTPVRFAFWQEDDSGYQQIRLWPAPGDVISYKYLYKKSPTLIVAESTELDTPSKYDDVVINLLVGEFTQDPADLVRAEEALAWMVRDNDRDSRDSIPKRGFGGGAVIGAGTEPRMGTGPG